MRHLACASALLCCSVFVRALTTHVPEEKSQIHADILDAAHEEEEVGLNDMWIGGGRKINPQYYYKKTIPSSNATVVGTPVNAIGNVAVTSKQCFTNIKATSATAETGFVCNDGHTCEGTDYSCCQKHHGRARCPSTEPHMCEDVTKGCGGSDHCCEKTKDDGTNDCTKKYGGVRSCPKTANCELEGDLCFPATSDGVSMVQPGRCAKSNTPDEGQDQEYTCNVVNCRAAYDICSGSGVCHRSSEGYFVCVADDGCAGKGMEGQACTKGSETGQCAKVTKAWPECVVLSATKPKTNAGLVRWLLGAAAINPPLLRYSGVGTPKEHLTSMLGEAQWKKPGIDISEYLVDDKGDYFRPLMSKSWAKDVPTCTDSRTMAILGVLYDIVDSLRLERLEPNTADCEMEVHCYKPDLALYIGSFLREKTDDCKGHSGAMAIDINGIGSHRDLNDKGCGKSPWGPCWKKDAVVQEMLSSVLDRLGDGRTYGIGMPYGAQLFMTSMKLNTAKKNAKLAEVKGQAPAPATGTEVHTKKGTVKFSSHYKKYPGTWNQETETITWADRINAGSSFCSVSTTGAADLDKAFTSNSVIASMKNLPAGSYCFPDNDAHIHVQVNKICSDCTRQD